MTAQTPRFQRFVIEVEVEVEDPLTTRAATLRMVDLGEDDEDADAAPVPFDPEGRSSVRHAVSNLLVQSITEQGAFYGLRLVGAVVADRPVVDGVHPEVRLPERPARAEA